MSNVTMFICRYNTAFTAFNKGSLVVILVVGGALFMSSQLFVKYRIPCVQY